jgi:hypothetical protein
MYRYHLSVSMTVCFRHFATISSRLSPPPSFPFALVACRDDGGDDDADTASAAGGMVGKGIDASGDGGGGGDANGGNGGNEEVMRDPDDYDGDGVVDALDACWSNELKSRQRFLRLLGGGD